MEDGKQGEPGAVEVQVFFEPAEPGRNINL